MEDDIKILKKSEVEELMPQQFPFLFLEDAKIEGTKITSSYYIRGDEFFLEGHFKGNPVFPAALSIEAVGQLGVLYLLAATDKRLKKPVDPKQIFFTSADGVRCFKICRPKDRIDLEVEITAIRHPLAVIKANTYVNGERASHTERVCLTFNYKD
ncbi:MAG: 3-hydroxyacyl-ACP dehydratase [Opitutales bacterium]